MTVALASLLYRWRIPLSLFVVVGALALAPRANITKIDNDLSAWFSREDPVYQAYERFRQEFGGTRTFIVALQSDRLFSRAGLEFLRQATEEIERVPLVQRVHSLANANVVQAVPDRQNGQDVGETIEVRPLLDPPLDGRPVDPAAVRTRALQDRLIRGDLVSEDGTVAAIVVTFDEDRIDEVRGATIDRIHAVIDPKLPEGMQAFYNGSVEISETYNRITLANQRTFIPPILVLTLLAIYAMFRSIRKTIVTFFAIGVSVLWTLGLYSLLGFTYNVLTSMIVPLVVVLAIADDVHIMQHFDHEVRQHGDRERAFRSAVRWLFAPLLGASATTAIGMLSLATSNVVAVKSFGIGAAIGVMVDFAISLVFVPTVLTLLKPDATVPPQEKYFVGPMRHVARFACGHPRLVLAVALGSAIAAAAGITRLRVDTNHINFFAKRHPLRQSAEVIDRQLSGVYSFQILLEGDPSSMSAPDTLVRMDTLGHQLARLEHVRKVTSLADYVKRVNQVLHGGDPAAWVVPARADAIAQELFVFSLSDAGRRELERIVASDYSRAQISVKLASMSSDLVFDQIHQAERLAREAFAGTGIVTTVTGSGRLWSTLDHYLVVSQISSFGTAFLTVFGVIFLVFRSARFGALAIVANAFPVLAVLGIMGWLGISLNVATVMLASVTLGVVDDDTIHFISRYRREAAAGATTEEAIETAAAHEGRASLTTVLVNCLGYGVLMLSEYKPTAWFGSLLALTMAVAFLAEVFIVPATIMLVPGLMSAQQIARRVRTST